MQRKHIGSIIVEDISRPNQMVQQPDAQQNQGSFGNAVPRGGQGMGTCSLFGALKHEGKPHSC